MREQGIRWGTVLGLLLLTLCGATAHTVQHVTPQSMRHGRMTLGEMASRPLPDLPLSARSAPPPTSPLALLPVPGVGGGGLLGPFLRQFGPGAGGATPPALTQGFDGIGYTG